MRGVSIPGGTGRVSKLEVGDRVWFLATRRAWTVRARGPRYIILTQPFNLKRSVLYTVIDLEMGIRGTDNYIGSLGYETPEEIDAAMALFNSGEAEISTRNNITLDDVRAERRF